MEEVLPFLGFRYQTLRVVPNTDMSRYAKKRKRTNVVQTLAAELICPITQDLPVEPVMAADGGIYNRPDISKWFRTSNTSPLTNQEIPKTLIPVPRIRNQIEALVESGDLSDEQVQSWRTRVAEAEAMKAEVEDLRLKCEQNDRTAMMKLALLYSKGMKGLEPDQQKAVSLWKTAADLGSASAHVNFGLHNMNGNGIERSVSNALVYITQGMMLGSELGCYMLAMLYGSGRVGLKKDYNTARKFFEKMSKCSVMDATNELREEAKKWLQEHPPDSQPSDDPPPNLRSLRGDAPVYSADAPGYTPISIRGL